jgi:hypothetical protein
LTFYHLIGLAIFSCSVKRLLAFRINPDETPEDPLVEYASVSSSATTVAAIMSKNMAFVG